MWTWPPLSNLYICHNQGSHPYQSLSYTSGDTAADSPAHVSRVGLPAKDSPRKESLLSNLTGSFRSLHNLLEGMPQRNEPSAATAAKSSSLTRTGNHGGTTVNVAQYVEDTEEQQNTTFSWFLLPQCKSHFCCKADLYRSTVYRLKFTASFPFKHMPTVNKYAMCHKLFTLFHTVNVQHPGWYHLIYLHKSRNQRGN